MAEAAAKGAATADSTKAAKTTAQSTAAAQQLSRSGTGQQDYAAKKNCAECKFAHRRHRKILSR
jgi:hypothetical protein